MQTCRSYRRTVPCVNDHTRTPVPWPWCKHGDTDMRRSGYMQRTGAILSVGIYHRNAYMCQVLKLSTKFQNGIPVYLGIFVYCLGRVLVAIIIREIRKIGMAQDWSISTSMTTTA